MPITSATAYDGAMVPGTVLPLVFSFRRTLFGPGYAVEVKATNGRALCVHEGDSVWLYGVNPGGMAARGDDETDARKEFASEFTSILMHIAQATESFEEFTVLTRRFFEETNEGFEPDWIEAVKRVRDEGLTVADLQPLPADAPRHISIELKKSEAYAATDNESQLEPALAA